LSGLKVLYEIGYINPVLIASLKAKEIFEQQEIIKNAFEKGSVITADAGIKTLSRIALQGKNIIKCFFHILLNV